MSAAEVHKLDPTEVLLSDWQQVDADRFAISARWPAHHRFYAGAHGSRDALMLVECVRQSIPLLCHSAYDAPFGFRQAWEDLHFAVEPALLAGTDTPLSMRLDVTCSDVLRRGARVGGMTMTVKASWQGLPAAYVRTKFNNQSPAVYQRLRGDHGDLASAHARALPPGPPIDPGLVARENGTDVVLAAAPEGSPHTWQLRADLGHSVLFDHAVDHAPGMLLLEAARQAALARSPRKASLVGMTTRFIRYTEFDAPCHIGAELLAAGAERRDGTQVVRVTLTQSDQVVFTADVTTAVV
ncbi:ScbA/BarX family gamma-butyrolactone biosynthesis protein [Streptomyces sp. NPDC002795]|uniref:ScbA/BarX family gamma-butyrolactone biosynthesis protein n=1 Tax=Streptomyces sp. NPDC002795 TaxID=3364665 RepID=UPI003692A485